ncbi:MAG: helix-turn-helix domain-containing protein [Desulfotomaculales bacterium]
MIGDRIKELRESAGLSSLVLAEKAGLSPSYLREMESGRRDPDLKVLARIAVALGVTTAALLASDSFNPPGL